MYAKSTRRGVCRKYEFGLIKLGVQGQPVPPIPAMQCGRKQRSESDPADLFGLSVASRSVGGNGHRARIRALQAHPKMLLGGPPIGRRDRSSTPSSTVCRDSPKLTLRMLLKSGPVPCNVTGSYTKAH